MHPHLFYNHLFWRNTLNKLPIDLTWRQEDLDILHYLHLQGLDQGYLLITLVLILFHRFDVKSNANLEAPYSS